MRPAARQRGVTLIELLVVLAILALVATIAVMSAPPPHGPAREEADRFAARLATAKQTAVLSGRLVRLDIAPDGYGFLTYTDGEWRPLDDVNLRQAHKARRVALRADIADPALKNEDEKKSLLRRDDATRRVIIDPVGIGAAFAVDFTDRREDWRVSYDEKGAVTVERYARS